MSALLFIFSPRKLPSRLDFVYHDPGGVDGNPSVCGAMTGGGSESILTAMKASRDYARATRSIRKPEMIIGDSAHAAYFKAAEYFKIKLVMVSCFSG